ncbi:hydrogenase accessory protein HypB [Gilliamella sp. wkB108]|uniref:hydrogenase nickel incorporation protein HypB n=1 Tax=Gilliamella sp. wkB108 TaxID=3120256 RepID=UPI00080DEA69|nr:hydrogenase nickel incorporation protein HypB [Gilliamella apicola]OCG26031.1 hydrogenase accessory protein HypB [Gilliamella apicola]
MCITCGCESHNSPVSEEPNHAHHHEQHTHHEPQVIHHHYYHNGDVHHHYHITADEHTAKLFIPHNDQDHEDKQNNNQQRLVEIEKHVLAKNDQIAEHNRQHFAERHIIALNLVSSPGSGKTTLLTETLGYLSTKYPCAVIEGDQQTSNDADRIAQTGVPVIQVNTGKGCHLDADMVHKAAHKLPLPENGFLFIENVGNLVCPASFDLGEKLKVVVMSVTEGDDKPLKYPHMFAAAGLMIINKIDLINYVNFDIQQCITNARRINPNLAVICLSCIGGEGLSDWFEWLETQQCV